MVQIPPVPLPFSSLLSQTLLSQILCFFWIIQSILFCRVRQYWLLCVLSIVHLYSISNVFFALSICNACSLNYVAIPWYKNSCPCDEIDNLGNEIDNLGRHFFAHQYYKFSLIDLCQCVEKKILKEKMHFTLKSIWPRPTKITPASGTSGKL